MSLAPHRPASDSIGLFTPTGSEAAGSPQVPAVGPKKPGQPTKEVSRSYGVTVRLYVELMVWPLSVPVKFSV